MRKFLIFCVLASIFVACTKEDMSEMIQEEAETYTVSFKMGGEIADITESPLRATSNDLWGIQVYYTHPNETIERSYGFQLTDNPDAVTIKLRNDLTYRFVCSMVVDGKSKIAQFGFGYMDPFVTRHQTTITSYFQYQELVEFDNGEVIPPVEYDMFGLNDGFSYLADSTDSGPYGDYMTDYYIPNTDRYYGEISGYRPSANGFVNINMKRTVFGIKLVGQNLTEGKLVVQLAEAPALTLTYPEREVQDIYTFKRVDNAFFTNNYSERINGQITWIKNDGTVVPVITGALNFSRNKLTTINVRVNNGSTGIGFNLEDSEMTEGETVNI